MKYRCKHSVEALRWQDTPEIHELFKAWFARHGAALTVVDGNIVLPEEGVVDEGEWVLFIDEEFLAMSNEIFVEAYEAVP